jgi:hypothetical protein
VTIKVGDGYIALRKLKIRNVETRWREPVDTIETLHEGKYIVDWIRGNEVHLSDADWDATGRITFHSAKHGHILDIKDLRKLKKERKKLRD